MTPGDFKVLTFDCYGTLIDWETGLLEALSPLAKAAATPLSPDVTLATHSRHESEQERSTPTRRYSDLLATVHKRLAEEWMVPTRWEDSLTYGRSIKNWPAFPDSAAALAALKQKYRLVILSNVDNESFAFSNTKLGVQFDAIYTAEDIGSYKPSRRNFEYMLEKLKAMGVNKADILHTAQSLYHDHQPAKELGLATCWIDRRHARGGGFGATVKPEIMPQVDFRFTSMAEFADAATAGK